MALDGGILYSISPITETPSFIRGFQQLSTDCNLTFPVSRSTRTLVTIAKQLVFSGLSPPKADPRPSDGTVQNLALRGKLPPGSEQSAVCDGLMFVCR